MLQNQVNTAACNKIDFSGNITSKQENNENLLIEDKDYLSYCREIYDSQKQSVVNTSSPLQKKKPKVNRVCIKEKPIAQFSGLQSYVLKEIVEDSRVNERSNSMSSQSSDDAIENRGPDND